MVTAQVPDAQSIAEQGAANANGFSRTPTPPRVPQIRSDGAIPWGGPLRGHSRQFSSREARDMRKAR